MTTVERFQIGIDKYGWDSEFRKTVESIVNQTPVDYQQLLKCFEKYQI